MPRRDGTGPIGAGLMTGKGLGFCMNQNEVRYSAGLGLACRRGFGGGFGRGFATNQNSAKTNKDLIRSGGIDYAKANEMEESMLPARKK